MQIRFREFLLDEERYVLERSGRRLAIRPKVFDLLVYLARNRRRVVRREELVQVLWGGAVVGPGSLSGLVNELRQVLGENGRDASSIRTVHARGYQFVAPVESLDPVERSGPSSDPSASADDAAAGASAEAARLVGVVAERGARGVLVESPPSGLPELRPILAASARAGFEVLRRASPASSPAAFDAFARALVDWAGGASAPASRLPGLRAVSYLQEGPVEGVVRRRVRAGPGDVWAALASILSEHSRRQPLTLVVEDVARSGIGFAAALSRLVVRLDTAPVLVVALASRDEGSGAARGGWRRALLRDPSFSTWRSGPTPDRSPLAHALQQSGMTESLVAAFDAEVNASPRLRAALREWLGPATTEADGSIGTSTGRAVDPTSSGELDARAPGPPLRSPSASSGGSVASSGGSVASSGGSVGERGVRRVEPGGARRTLKDARSDGNHT